MSITFTRDSLHGTPHPAWPQLKYMELVVGDGVGGISRFSGYVTPATAALIEAAPELIEALKRIGDPEFRYSSDDDEDTQLSLRIADARAALAKAESKS